MADPRDEVGVAFERLGQRDLRVSIVGWKSCVRSSSVSYRSWLEHRSGPREVGGCCAVNEPGLSGALDRRHLRDAVAIIRHGPCQLRCHRCTTRPVVSTMLQAEA